MTALEAVDIGLYPGEVNAVLGENGAGKSTLVGILSGNIAQDSGEILLDGLPTRFSNARAAKSAGVDVVHQHFMLVPQFSVAENLALAASEGSGPVLNIGRLSAKALGASADLGWRLPADAKVGSLSVGEQQRVEIAKALAGGGRVVLLDEPTSTLSQDEVTDLFRVIEALKRDRRSIVFITHKLDEALAIADRVTVLRRGKVVVSTPAQGIAPGQLAHWMVGDVPPSLVRESRKPSEGAFVVANRLHIIGDRGHGAVRDVSFRIGAGEILGFGGVDGNGQLELAEALVGIRPIKSGSLATGRGSIAYIPQDRQRDGLALSMSVTDNLLIAGHKRRGLSRAGLFLTGAIRAWCETLVARFQIRTDSLQSTAEMLSGGNQQKIVVARSLDTEPALIVAVNPTRGLDVQAEHYVHSLLLEARGRGAAIALFTTDIGELGILSDRAVYMSGGRILEGGNVAEMIGGRE
ncbi:MAG: ABC transporter ATP-binding protein [Fimbriimonadales bacterium]